MGVNWAGLGVLAGLYGADQGAKIGREYISYSLQKSLQANAAKLNYDYSIKSLQNSPSATREGLVNAGYNPMLAVQNSTSGANSSWTSAGNTTSHSNDNSLANAFSNAQDVQRLKNETVQAESVADANYATADKAKAEKAEISARLPYVSQRQKAEISKLEADAQLAEAKKHNLKERLELDRYINDSGLATTRRGQDMVYNASTLTPSKYLIDKGESIYTSLGRPKTPKELGEGIARYYYNRRKR